MSARSAGPADAPGAVQPRDGMPVPLRAHAVSWTQTREQESTHGARRGHTAAEPAQGAVAGVGTLGVPAVNGTVHLSAASVHGKQQREAEKRANNAYVVPSQQHSSFWQVASVPSPQASETDALHSSGPGCESRRR